MAYCNRYQFAYVFADLSTIHTYLQTKRVQGIGGVRLPKESAVAYALASLDLSKGRFGDDFLLFYFRAFMAVFF